VTDLRVVGGELLPPANERRHLLSIADLTKDEVERLLATARSFALSQERDNKKLPTLRGTDLGMAQHDHVRVVCGKGERRVLERLALVDGRAGGLQRHRVGRQPLRGQLEGRRRARRRLVEDVQDQPAAQCRQLLVVAFL
jgi:hypothetical protein